MAGRRTAIIATSALAVVQPACAGDAAEQTDAAVSVATTLASNVTAQLHTVIEEAVGASASIPGLVLHVEAPGRRLDVSVATGVADCATGTPLGADAGFRIASNTKTFTAAAILRLVEQDRLGLDVPIGDLLAPETVDALRTGGYRPDAITVRHVLVHTSGMYDVGQDPAYEAAVNADPVKRWTRLEQVRFAMDHGAPVGEPGAGYAYSDTGYGLLGEIIERVTGTPLAEAYRTLLDFERRSPGRDVTIAASWTQATPDQDFDGERLFERVFELATA